MKQSNLDQIRRILVITLSNIGDVIVTTPVISLLREKFPSAHLAVLVGPKANDLFFKSKTVNQTFIYEKKTTWFQKLKLIYDLRKQNFDLVVDLKNTAIPYLVGAKHKTSLGLDRSHKLRRDQHLSRLQFLMPVTFGEPNHFDFFSEQDLDSASKKLNLNFESCDNFIVISPGARGYLKRWTPQGFSEVANYFLKKNKSVVLMGSSDEADLGQEISRLTAGRVMDAIGKLTLRELAAVISKASLIIVNDSASLHFAVEIGRPVVAIFGPTDETKCGRFDAKFKVVRLAEMKCAPCLAAHCLLPKRICLDELPARDVINACEALLYESIH